MKKLLSAIIVLFTMCLGAAAQQKITVTGVITDETGQPMIGAAVMEKGSAKNGAVTDLDGKYTIKVPSNAFIEISSMGYKTVLKSVDGQKTINVKMESDANQLEATVVIGYGTSKKGDLTGAVSVVNLEEIENDPVSSVTQSLQGKISGVEISSGTGEAGEDATIRIRGSRSITAGNEPLIVVDGVVDAVSSLSDINPADIVSISVLKDVSSTAIYGSRGANGVILVTTQDSNKRDDGVFNIKAKASVGVSGIAGSLDIMNAAEWANWRNMCAANQHKEKEPFPNPESYGEGTDWIKTLTRLAIYQNYFISAYGKVKKTDYSASFGYIDSPSIVICSGSKKYTGKVHLGSYLTKGLKLAVDVSFTQTNTDKPTCSITGTSTTAAVYLPPMLKPTDTWNSYGSDTTTGSPFNNPYLVATTSTNKVSRTSFMIAPVLSYKFKHGFLLKGRFSYSFTSSDTGTYSPSTLPVAQSNHAGGTASRSHYKKQNILGELTLDYKKKHKRNNYEALLGFTAESQTTNGDSYKGTGYTDDNLTFYNIGGLMNAANLTANSYEYSKMKLSALLRFQYNYDRRYYVTVTMRGDGASNFAASKQWGFFPAAAFRWSIMNEKWFKKAHWLNDLSLRLSGGRSGNDALQSYLSLATLESAASSWIFGDSKQQSFYPAKLENSNLTWETTDSYDLGLNFSAWQSRVTIEFDAYVTYTRDLLLNVRNSQTTGYNTYYANAGKTRNIGQEFSLSTRNIVTRNFEWTSVLTISHNDQVVVDVGSENEVVPTYTNPRNSTQYMYGYKKGYPVNALWGYQYEGVWHNQEEINRNTQTHAYVSQIKPGLQGAGLGHPKYADINHDGMLDLNDMVYLGSSDPVVFGGFQNTFTIYKRLKLGIYFSYSIGGKIYNIMELYAGNGIQNYNKFRFMSGAWTEKNTESNLPKAGFDDVQASSRNVYDASFFRLKTLSASYDIPLSPDVKKYIKGGISVGITADNVFLIKSYPGFDPDVNTSSTVYRLDNGSYPRPWTCAANVQFKF